MNHTIEMDLLRTKIKRKEDQHSHDKNERLQTNEKLKFQMQEIEKENISWSERYEKIVLKHKRIDQSRMIELAELRHMNEWLDDQRKMKHQQIMETFRQEYEKKCIDIQCKVEQKCKETTQKTRNEYEDSLKKVQVTHNEAMLHLQNLASTREESMTCWKHKYTELELTMNEMKTTLKMDYETRVHALKIKIVADIKNQHVQKIESLRHEHI